MSEPCENCGTLLVRLEAERQGDGTYAVWSLPDGFPPADVHYVEDSEDYTPWYDAIVSRTRPEVTKLIWRAHSPVRCQQMRRNPDVSPPIRRRRDG